MKVLIYMFCSLIAILILGALIEQSLRWKDLKLLKREAMLVKIMNQQIQYRKIGNGNCTVVFESGLGSDLSIWNGIQDSVAKHTVTLAYNRSGITLSEHSDETVTNASVAKILFALLEKTGCPKPYILVAHSMGGIYVRKFISEHQRDVAGLVLVDAAHPLQMKKASKKLLQSVSTPPTWFVESLMYSGLYRLIFSVTGFPPEVLANNPINVQQRKYFYLSYPATMREAANDKVNFEDAEKYSSFGRIPLAVITGTSDLRTKGMKDASARKEYQVLVFSLQQDLLNLSANSWLVKAEHSGHIIQASEPQLITEQINLVLQKSTLYK